MIKNTFSNKSGNPQKIMIAVGKLLGNVHILGKDLLRMFFKLFCLGFCVSSDQ